MVSEIINDLLKKKSFMKAEPVLQQDKAEKYFEAWSSTQFRCRIDWWNKKSLGAVLTDAELLYEYQEPTLILSDRCFITQFAQRLKMWSKRRRPSKINVIGVATRDHRYQNGVVLEGSLTYLNGIIYL